MLLGYHAQHALDALSDNLRIMQAQLGWEFQRLMSPAFTKIRRCTYQPFKPTD